MKRWEREQQKIERLNHKLAKKSRPGEASGAKRQFNQFRGTHSDRDGDLSEQTRFKR